MPLQKWARTQKQSNPHLPHALFQHTSVSVYLLCLEATVHFVDLFSASETISVAIGKGINFMQIYANNCDTQLHPDRYYANDVCLTSILEGPIFPSPLTSNPPLNTTSQSVLLTIPSPVSVALCFSFFFWFLSFFFHLPLPSLQSSLIPSPPFLSLGQPLCPVMLSLVSPNTPTPTLSLCLHSSL